MASEMPPAAEQQKSLLAQYHKRLMWRLAAWGGAAAFSLAAAVIVSQTASGNKRLQIALFGSEHPYQIPASVASTTVPMPPADLIAVKRTTEAVRRATEEVKRVTDRTAARLEAVERNTADARAETKRLALQVSKLSTDSFRVAGRLANIENQVDGITGSIKDMTGSIKKQAEEAATAAVAKAMPPKPAFDKVFDLNAPVISPPLTTYPNLSLIVPPGQRSTSSPETPDEMKADVSTTSAIPTPKPKLKDQSRVASRREGTNVPEARQMARATSRPQELKAGVGIETKAARDGDDKPMAKAEHNAARSAPTRQVAHVTVRPSYYSRSLLPTRGYGIDLGGADSVTVVQAQWAAVKANFGPMLTGMRPTAVRDHRILAGGEFRLVVSRVHSLKAAERLCKRLAKHQLSCHPIEFDDGKVVWR